MKKCLMCGSTNEDWNFSKIASIYGVQGQNVVFFHETCKFCGSVNKKREFLFSVKIDNYRWWKYNAVKNISFMMSYPIDDGKLSNIFNMSKFICWQKAEKLKNFK